MLNVVSDLNLHKLIGLNFLNGSILLNEVRDLDFFVAIEKQFIEGKKQ